VGDAAVTLPVGEIDQEAERLLKITEEALYKGIEKAIVNNRLSDISHAVQAHAESNNFSVVRDFVGHGIGRKMHEEPQVPNFGMPGRGPRLKAGMALAIGHCFAVSKPFAVFFFNQFVLAPSNICTPAYPHTPLMYSARWIYFYIVDFQVDIINIHV
jgi:Xaa-Pro aminopeptidase